MSKKTKLEKLNNQLLQIQAEVEKEKVDSEKPTDNLDKALHLDDALEEIQNSVKQVSEKYTLNYYELFGILKILEAELIETSREE